MTTKEMQAAVGATGSHMRQEEYASTNAQGLLVSRHRWAVHAADAAPICRGVNPAQCFARWRRFRFADFMTRRF